MPQAFRKSSYSHANNGCVEVGAGQGVVGIRDTKSAGAGPVLAFNSATWVEFLTEVKK